VRAVVRLVPGSPGKKKRGTAADNRQEEGEKATQSGDACGGRRVVSIKWGRKKGGSEADALLNKRLAVRDTRGRGGKKGKTIPLSK